tara:strand:- start:533 stop:1249 length:717 start_codon:yes stop_codon:yes gene_type:complete
MSLVAFGCSITAGQGLEDIYPPNSEGMYAELQVTSKLAWPQLLADLFDCTVNNLGHGGSSNKQILHTILNYNFTQDDIVVICWTHVNRWCLIKTADDIRFRPNGSIYEDDIETLGLWNCSQPLQRRRSWLGTRTKDPITKTATAFYEHIYDDEDMKQEMLRNIQFAKLYLDTKQIKNYHMTLSYDQYTYKWFDTDLLPIDWQKIKDENPYAPDNQHPGSQAHQIVAQEVFKLTQGLST